MRRKYPRWQVQCVRGNEKGPARCAWGTHRLLAGCGGLALKEAGRDQTRGTLGTPVKSLTVQQGDSIQSCPEKCPQAVTA